MRRSRGGVVPAVALLAVVVLAGLGLAASLRAGARAERVRGLVPFTGALTTLVDGLQRERELSARQAGAGERAPEASGADLAAVRAAVDGAAAAYRDAAVRVEISDRDRALHRRLDTGLAQVAGLEALRASVDGAAGAGDAAAAPATVFRGYTDVIGGLIAVGGEIGLREAGQDAELLRAVTAATAFWRARELAEREREAAARAAALGRLDPAERMRLAALSGRQDVLLDQFGAMAGREQLERYGRALPAAEVERAGRARRAALEGGSGPVPAGDLAAWSETATARAERMRALEPGLNGEVARLAGLADRAADRRALAYGAVLVLACCSAVVLALLGPRRAPRADAPAPPAEAPAAQPPPAPPAVPEPRPARGLADLARRGQELVDQQLELLGQAQRNHADPKLPGRLLQVDRLAIRARRTAHNLVVLAGGEPSRRWDGPVPLTEVVAVAVRDNRDAPRVDVQVADGLLVVGAAADDLASLIGELVDNATAFSAPETRVRVSGQKVGSGYVLEIEDRGLGMTDGELESVNRRLAGHRTDGDDREPRLGTWVAGRLAERHDVKVQLRRSAYGGVTALVFFPEHLTIAPPGRPAAPRPGAPARRDASAGAEGASAGRDAAGDREGGALVELPLRRYVSEAPGRAGQDLPKRAPSNSLAPDLAAGEGGRPAGRPSRTPPRDPEQVRNMLSKYRSGLERGRAAAARDLPDDPDDDPPA